MLNLTIRVQGRRRKCLLYVPGSYDENVSAPLVLSFHGFADWPARHAAMTRWNNLAEECRFLVAYPSGTGFPLRWNTRPSPADHWTPEMEVAFVDALIDRLMERYNIDSSRVFVNGFSNGGGMTLLLAKTLPQRIAAFGTVATAIFTGPEEIISAKPLRMIFFHGTADPIVPYMGGARVLFHGSFPNVPQWVGEFARCLGCVETPLHLPAQGAASGIAYTFPGQGDCIHFYTIAGGGHAWPGGLPLPVVVVGHTTQDIDATRMMWDFFIQRSSILDRQAA